MTRYYESISDIPKEVINRIKAQIEIETSTNTFMIMCEEWSYDKVENNLEIEFCIVRGMRTTPSDYKPAYRSYEQYLFHGNAAFEFTVRTFSFELESEWELGCMAHMEAQENRESQKRKR